ncbi:hypothetical protein TNCV_4696081 [Trichonephila clavipes]|nr:hypothetical protein TNCV_4696081 [Trichonephila clavipes]
MKRGVSPWERRRGHVTGNCVIARRRRFSCLTTEVRRRLKADDQEPKRQKHGSRVVLVRSCFRHLDYMCPCLLCPDSVRKMDYLS